MDDLISRQAAIDAHCELCGDRGRCNGDICPDVEVFQLLPSAQPEGWVKIPDTGIDDLSDGFHTFRQLYCQRMMLFATIVRQNREKAWKSLRHEDGEPCFGGGWFIVGIDTPEGSYTYHYEDNFYSLFDCEELECAKHWDGHTEKDVTRLLSLPSAQPEPSGEYARGYNDAKREIALSGEYERAYQRGKEDAQQWIPCSERLPEDDDYKPFSYYEDGAVLFCTKNGKVGFGWYYESTKEWANEDDHTPGEVIAWMPIPEPYKGEES